MSHHKEGGGPVSRAWNNRTNPTTSKQPTTTGSGEKYSSTPSADDHWACPFEFGYATTSIAEVGW